MSALLELRHVSLRYGAGERTVSALQDVSLVVAPITATSSPG